MLCPLKSFCFLLVEIKVIPQKNSGCKYVSWQLTNYLSTQEYGDAGSRKSSILQYAVHLYSLIVHGVFGLLLVLVSTEDEKRTYCQLTDRLETWHMTRLGTMEISSTRMMSWSARFQLMVGRSALPMGMWKALCIVSATTSLLNRALYRPESRSWWQPWRIDHTEDSGLCKTAELGSCPFSACPWRRATCPVNRGVVDITWRFISIVVLIMHLHFLAWLFTWHKGINWAVVLQPTAECILDVGKDCHLFALPENAVGHKPLEMPVAQRTTLANSKGWRHCADCARRTQQSWRRCGLADVSGSRCTAVAKNLSWSGNCCDVR